VKIRSSKLEQDILARIGIMNLNAFYQSNRIFAPEIIANVVGAMQQYKYGLSILLAGVDDNGPHLFRIDDPGRKEIFDTIGHCSVGSGELHAISSFIANDYSHNLDLDHIVAMVYEAKRRSEKAVGVGNETDICIICKDGTVKVPDGKIKNLDVIYDKKITHEKDIVQLIEDEVKKLKMSELDNKTDVKK
jgi:20S proteasome alpha/beta subunit